MNGIVTEHLKQRAGDETLIVYSMEVVHGGVLYRTCNAPPYKTGKRAGTPNYTKRTNDQAWVITSEQNAALRQEWTDRTGKCLECSGSGQVWTGWAHDVGHSYKACVNCAGTGMRALA